MLFVIALVPGLIFGGKLVETCCHFVIIASKWLKTQTASLVFRTKTNSISWKANVKTEIQHTHGWISQSLSSSMPGCWFHRPSIISAASNVVFWTFFRAKTCCVACHVYCFYYGGTNMARKDVWKPHSIRLLRWFNFSQSGSRKTIEKPLKEFPWNQQWRFLFWKVFAAWT